MLCSNCNKKNQITKKLREAHLIVICDFNTHIQIQGNKNRFPIFKIFRIFSITHFSRHLFFNSCNSFLKTIINFDRAFNKLFFVLKSMTCNVLLIAAHIHGLRSQMEISLCTGQLELLNPFFSYNCCKKNSYEK